MVEIGEHDIGELHLEQVDLLAQDERQQEVERPGEDLQVQLKRCGTHSGEASGAARRYSGSRRGLLYGMAMMSGMTISKRNIPRMQRMSRRSMPPRSSLRFMARIVEAIRAVRELFRCACVERAIAALRQLRRGPTPIASRTSASVTDAIARAFSAP